MRREFILAAFSTVVAAIVALFLWRGISTGARPKDLTLVRSTETAPPFFDLTLATEVPVELLEQDPITIVRGAPFFRGSLAVGPHDALGFRNEAVPITADVLAIGDSQTYGMNAIAAESWPAQLGRSLPGAVYNAAVGGWGAPQYLELFRRLKILRPQAVIVAFYAGNDALESFKAAYAIERFAELRVDPQLSIDDLPPIPARPPTETQWNADLPSGARVGFVPGHRLISNDPDSKVVAAGYGIMIHAAQLIAAESGAAQAIFLLIPTKELVFAPTVGAGKTSVNAEFTQLVDAELLHRERFERTVSAISGVTYIDVLPALRSAISRGEAVYPPHFDGHPLSPGYRAIADALAPAIRLSRVADGTYRVADRVYQVNAGRRFLVATEAAGLPEAPPQVSELLSRLPLAGVAQP